MEKLEELKKLVVDLKDQEIRDKFSEDAMSHLQETVCCISSKLTVNSNQEDVESDLDILAECFRCLRNACVNCPKNQTRIVSCNSLLNELDSLMKCLLSRVHIYRLKNASGRPDKELVCLRCGMQLLGNAVMGHQDNQGLVWNKFNTQFRYFLDAPDDTLCNYTCMVVYSCLTPEHLTQMLGQEEGAALVNSVMQCFVRSDSEWAMCILDRLMQEPCFIEGMFSTLESDAKLHILDFVIAKVKNHETIGAESSVSVPIHIRNMCSLQVEFKSQAHTILGLRQQSTVNETVSLLAMKLLDILNVATPMQGYISLLESDDTLKCAVNLLHCVQMIGNEGSNIFSNVSKVTEAASVDSSHPAYGLKRDLIRLIGNMCYRHRHNQDLVRDLGGIHLILDHTNIDARNPLITQWAVFAVRNLCEQNLNNQAVIAGMKLEGMADSAQMLRDFGVDAHVEDDQVVIRNVNASDSSPFSKDGGS